MQIKNSRDNLFCISFFGILFSYIDFKCFMNFKLFFKKKY